MRTFLFQIILCLTFNLITARSQEISPIVWQTISPDNANEVTLALEFQLETPADLSNSSVYIDNLATIPNTTYVFVSYKDRDTRQRFVPIWQIWDIEAQVLIFSEISSAGTIAFSPDGQFFALRETAQNAETQLCLWQVVDFTRLNCWDSGSILVNSFHPTNESFFFYRPVENDTIRQLIIWDIISNQERYIIDDVNEWNFHPLDPYQIATYNIDTIQLWDIENGVREVLNYQIGDEVMVSNVAFDSSANNVFFSTFSFVDSTEYLNRLSLASSELTIKQGEITQSRLFYRLYVNVFPSKSENPLMIDWIDGMTYEIIRTIMRGSVLESNLNQDLLLVTSNDEPLRSNTFTIQNLYTAEIYATLPYVVEGMRYQDVRFTQDERFIIAYTEGGLVQLWGVPAEG